MADEWIEIEGKRWPCRLTSTQLVVQIHDDEVRYRTPTKRGDPGTAGGVAVRKVQQRRRSYVRMERGSINMPGTLPFRAEKRPPCSPGVGARLEAVALLWGRRVRRAHVKALKSGAKSRKATAARKAHDRLVHEVRTRSDGDDSPIVDAARAYVDVIDSPWIRYADEQALNELEPMTAQELA